MTSTLEDIVTFHELKAQGFSISEIARATGRDRKTVRKHLGRGLKAPAAKRRRRSAPRLLERYESYLEERVRAFPGIPGSRLMREIRELGYEGGYATVTRFLRRVRPRGPAVFAPRFETPPGHQAQVDFAEFKTEFADEPGVRRKVWLFSLLLGHSRWLWGRFCTDQRQQTMLRMHIAAFEALGGVPRQVLHDRMKTAVAGTDDRGAVLYNPAYVDMLGHYGARPRACRPYRAQTKGKVERSFSHVRSDFHLGGRFQNLDDLNARFDEWRERVANPRRHATTGRIVSEAFAEERPALLPLPGIPWNGLVRAERRRVSRDGLVSVDGNRYSVPDGLTGRSVLVHVHPGEVRILDGNGELAALHAVPEGRGRVLSDPSHRRAPGRGAEVAAWPGIDTVPVRDLAFYGRVGERLAAGARP